MEGGSFLFEFREAARVIAVIALVVVAAALATPKGRVPLALRGVLAILKKDTGTVGTNETNGTVPGWKRLLAFVLVLVAALLALI